VFVREHKPDPVPCVAVLDGFAGRRPFIWDARCRPPHARDPFSSRGHGPNNRSHLRELLALARGGVCHALTVTSQAVRSYRTFSPLPAEAGGIFSAALSLTQREPVGVTHHRVLPCPDFPPSLENRSLQATAAACSRGRLYTHGQGVGPDLTLGMCDIKLNEEIGPGVATDPGWRSHAVPFPHAATRYLGPAEPNSLA
jgi:hypothetical protein